MRIAGVNVGKVTEVCHLAAEGCEAPAELESDATAQTGDEPTETEEPAPSTATVVTMELDESALPLHTDSTLKLRPRLFLEGNMFVDLSRAARTRPRPTTAMSSRPGRPRSRSSSTRC